MNSSLCSCLLNGNKILVRAASKLQSPFLLIIRLYWGWQFFLTGKGKLMHIERTANFFQTLHIPMPTLNAYIAGTTECIGGLFLLLGLASRAVSIPLIFTMIVAYLTTELDAIKNIYQKPDDFLSAAPFLFLLASTIVLIFGPGAFSLDRLIQKRCSK